MTTIILILSAFLWEGPLVDRAGRAESGVANLTGNSLIILNVEGEAAQ